MEDKQNNKKQESSEVNELAITQTELNELGKEIDKSIDRCYFYIEKEKELPKRLHNGTPLVILDMITKLRKMKTNVNIRMKQKDLQNERKKLYDFLTK